MAIFVLVHGAWHNGSARQVTAWRLEKMGHQAFAPMMAEHGMIEAGRG